MSVGLAIVVFAVADVARARAFYVGAFGWEPSVDLPVYVQFRLPGHVGVSLYQCDDFARQTGEAPLVCPAGASTATELYLQVDDLETATARLLAAGARSLSPAARRDWGDTTAYFADPDGNVIAVFAESE